MASRPPRWPGRSRTSSPTPTSSDRWRTPAKHRGARGGGRGGHGGQAEARRGGGGGLQKVLAEDDPAPVAGPGDAAAPAPKPPDGSRVMTDGRVEKSPDAPHQYVDSDPVESQEWRDSLDTLVRDHGADRARYIMLELQRRAAELGIGVPDVRQTDYINTIHPDEEPPTPATSGWRRRSGVWCAGTPPSWCIGHSVPASAWAGTSRPLRRRRRCTRWGSTTSSGAGGPGGGDQVFFQGMPHRASTPGRSWRAASATSSSTASGRS